MAIADDIDRLYQLPLAEFTAARNDLAKRAAAADKLQVTSLHKPTLPAWAVNQLYWRKRRVFDRLMTAAQKLRVEHGRQLSGRRADVAAAEEAHREAIKAATEEIRGVLKAAGETDTHATMMAVADTLQALPGRDDHGRLVKPLKPMGFEALAGLVPRGGATIARLSEVKPIAPPSKALGTASGKVDAAAQKRAEAERRARAAQAERDLRAAIAAERDARVDYARTEASLARIERNRKDLQARLDEAIVERDALAVTLDQKKRELDKAKMERERLEFVRGQVRFPQNR